MAFNVHTFSPRYYGIVAALYVVFCSVNAFNFPGRGQDIDTMLVRSRSIQSIRDSILRTLGRASTNIRDRMLPEPQNMTSPATPLEPEFISETQEIIAFSEPVENVTSDNVFKFSLTKDNRTHEIQSASVLVQVRFKRRKKNSKRISKKRRKVKAQRIKLILSTVDDKGRIIQQVSSRKAKISRTNWFKLFLPKNLIKRALNSDNASIKLYIRCKGCKKFAKLVLLHGTKRKRKRSKTFKRKGRRHRLRSRTPHRRKLSRTRPFLLIHTKVNIRNKRHANECDRQKNQCCKIPFSFSFAEAGWSDWVISPQFFKTHVCSGGCNSGLNWNRKYNYTYNCVDKKHKPLRIMYFDKTGTFITTKLPRMIVTECGCS